MDGIQCWSCRWTGRKRDERAYLSMPSQQTNMQKGYPTPKKNSQQDCWVQGNEPKRPVKSKLQNSHLSLLKTRISLPDQTMDLQFTKPPSRQSIQARWWRRQLKLSEKGWPLIYTCSFVTNSTSSSKNFWSQTTRSKKFHWNRVDRTSNPIYTWQPQIQGQGRI